MDKSSLRASEDTVFHLPCYVVHRALTDLISFPARTSETTSGRAASPRQRIGEDSLPEPVAIDAGNTDSAYTHEVLLIAMKGMLRSEIQILD